MDPVTGGHRSAGSQLASRSLLPSPFGPAVVANAFARHLALVSFAALTLRGLVMGADFQSTLRTALLAIPVFFVLGLLGGDIARRVVEEQVEQQLPELASPTTSPSEASPVPPGGENRSS